MIAIQQPGIEALIHQRFETGSYKSLEDVVLHALNATAPAKPAAQITTADMLAALQRCPDPDFNFEFESVYSPASAPVEF